MLFPDYRPRRMRQNEAFRRMIRETHLRVDDLILPLLYARGGAPSRRQGTVTSVRMPAA